MKIVDNLKSLQWPCPRNHNYSHVYKNHQSQELKSIEEKWSGIDDVYYQRRRRRLLNVTNLYYREFLDYSMNTSQWKYKLPMQPISWTVFVLITSKKKGMFLRRRVWRVFTFISCYIVSPSELDVLFSCGAVIGQVSFLLWESSLLSNGDILWYAMYFVILFSMDFKNHFLSEVYITYKKPILFINTLY